MLRNVDCRGTWVAQLVKRLTLGFGSGHNLTVREFEPHIGLHTDGVEPAQAFVSPFPHAPLLLVLMGCT